MKSAFGPIRDTHRWDAPAPITSLTPGQRKAVVAIFFAGEMSRDGSCFAAEEGESVTGTTAAVLIERGLARLCVERTRHPERPKIARYRYFIKLTERGEWYATTLIQQRGALIDALSPELAPDNFEEASNVYPAETEAMYDGRSWHDVLAAPEYEPSEDEHQ